MTKWDVFGDTVYITCQYSFKKPTTKVTGQFKIYLESQRNACYNA